jgi:hypothetical protein
MEVVQRGVGTAPVEEIPVSALFDDTAVAQDHDPVSHPDGGEAM